jgi:hypothetical protein
VHLQFLEFNPQHGRAFLTVGFSMVLVSVETEQRCLLCSRAFLYSLCFTLLYRVCICLGFILRNLTVFCWVDLFVVELPYFLFIGCSVAGDIYVTNPSCFVASSIYVPDNLLRTKRKLPEPRSDGREMMRMIGDMGMDDACF